jgi:hypothetical protein
LISRIEYEKEIVQLLYGQQRQTSLR